MATPGAIDRRPDDRRPDDRRPDGRGRGYGENRHETVSNQPLEQQLDQPLKQAEPAAVRPNREEALAAVDTLIRWIGDDPSREGLTGTPDRVVRAYDEHFQGYAVDPVALLQRTFEEVEGYDEMVLLRDIRFESHCEHHIKPIIGRVHIAYLPEHRVVGISKLARVVDAYAKREVERARKARDADEIERAGFVAAAAGFERDFLLRYKIGRDDVPRAEQCRREGVLQGFAHVENARAARAEQPLVRVGAKEIDVRHGNGEGARGLDGVEAEEDAPRAEHLADGVDIDAVAAEEVAGG